jgi:hypothetical protein
MKKECRVEHSYFSRFSYQQVTNSLILPFTHIPTRVIFGVGAFRSLLEIYLKAPLGLVQRYTEFIWNQCGEVNL